MSTNPEQHPAEHPAEHPDASRWIEVLRSSHDRLTGLTESLDPEQVEQQSYDDDWTIAQVASHLGSGAEIFGLILAAGLSGSAAPDQDVFSEIWARWDALSPAEQVAESRTANESLVSGLERLSGEQRASFGVEAFGMSLDLAGLARLRLAEHAVHTWDVAVALDPAAEIAPDAVDLLVDRLGDIVAHAGQPLPEPGSVAIHTTAPERDFLLTTRPAAKLEPGAAEATTLQVPAEALVRLVYGRLDPDHTPAHLHADPVVAELRPMFPGV